MTRERLTLWFLLASTLAIRAIHPDQPIVENYVGRQIPTAMVARNLERGSGFLNPQLDTGPFPNLFLVEPPIYAQLVASIRPLIGFDLEPTGRLVSAAATTLAAWGLFGLVRRREGSVVALLALASFGFFPVMIRYGRAFQPDALMLGCVVAGLRGWDEYEESGNWRWAIFGGFVLSIGLALKVTVAWCLIPFALIVRRWPIVWRVAASVAMLAPAVAWYLRAWEDVARPGSGSLASFNNANLWLRSLSPTAWLRFSTYENLGRNLIVRSFTPVGFVLGFWGLLASGKPGALRRVGLTLPIHPERQGKPYPTGDTVPLDEPGKVDRLWLGWGIGCGLSILGLASKCHHAYYWIVLAPLAAVGVARGMVQVGKIGRPMAGLLGSFFLTLCLVQSASTWRTPVEWASLKEAAAELASLTMEEQQVIAPEALLHYAGRRGFRLEFDPAACRRAAGEWGRDLEETDEPLALVNFYRNFDSIQFVEQRFSTSRTRRTLVFGTSLTIVADVGSAEVDGRRAAWREAMRKRRDTTILIDKPGMMIAELH